MNLADLTRSSRLFAVILIVLSVTTSTVLIATVLSTPASADEITLEDSGTTMETLRIVDYEFTQLPRQLQ